MLDLAAFQYLVPAKLRKTGFYLLTLRPFRVKLILIKLIRALKLNPFEGGRNDKS
jgi:hypothetical protein